MTLSITPVDINADTWRQMILKVNEVIAGAANNFVTAGGNPTVGNVLIYGTLSANTINQNGTPVVDQSRQVTAGTGLTGGGNLSANRTLSLNSNTITSLGYANTALQSLVEGTGVVIDNSDPRNPIITATGSGDMLKATYDPSNVAANAFLMSNMTEGTDAKILTAAERTKLSGIETSADVTSTARVGTSVGSASSAGSIADGDQFTGILASSTTLFRTTWTTIKSTLKTYFDALYVPVARTITASTGLTGGGDLTANRSLAIDKASTSQIRSATADKVVTSDGVLDAMDWVAITSGASPAIDHSAGVNRTITHTANATMGAPSNTKPGWPLNIDITPGAYTTSWNSVYKFGAAGAPSITARRIAHFICRNSTTYVFLGLSDPS